MESALWSCNRSVRNALHRAIRRPHPCADGALKILQKGAPYWHEVGKAAFSRVAYWRTQGDTAPVMPCLTMVRRRRRLLGDHGAGILGSGGVNRKIIDHCAERVLPIRQRHPAVLSGRERFLRPHLVPISTRDWLIDCVNEGLGSGRMAGHLRERDRSGDSPIGFHVKSHQGKRTWAGPWLGSIL